MTCGGLSSEVTRWAAHTLTLGPRLQLLVDYHLLIVLSLTRLVSSRHLLLAHLSLERLLVVQLMLLLRYQLLLLRNLVLLLGQLHLLLLADLRHENLLLVVFRVLIGDIVSFSVYTDGSLSVATFAGGHLQYVFTVLAIADLSALLYEPKFLPILKHCVARRVRLVVLVGASSFLLDLMIFKSMLIVLLTARSLCLNLLLSIGSRKRLDFCFACYVQDRLPDFLGLLYIVDDDSRFSLILLLTFHYLNYLTS